MTRTIENKEENQLKNQVQAIDSLSIDTKDFTSLEEKIGSEAFNKFIQSAYLDKLTVQENERLKQLTSLVELKFFCNSDKRENLRATYQAYEKSIR